MSTWRVGRKVGRTIYDGDALIGVMDTAELAEKVVRAVNGAEDARPDPSLWVTFAAGGEPTTIHCYPSEVDALRAAAEHGHRIAQATWGRSVTKTVNDWDAAATERQKRRSSGMIRGFDL